MTDTAIDTLIEGIADEWGHYTIVTRGINPMVFHAHVVEIAEGFRTLAVHTIINGWDATVYVPYHDIASITDMTSTSPL